LVAELDARLAASPDDLQGWMLLGRSRVVLGDFEGAVGAWRNAQRLSPDDPTVLANLGEALVLTDETQLGGEAAWLFDAAIEADPRNPKALWYGGLAAEARGDDGLATARWRALLALDPPDVLRAVIERRLAAADPDAWRVDVVVTIGEGLTEPAQGSTLFVTAHGVETSGPPLAAVRVPVDAWPMRVSLTEAAAMLADAALADRDTLRIVARVSHAGMAERAPGDLIGETRWQRDGDSAHIVLDRIIE
jgi:cytochrome c-type biogenesis protein CcmH